VVGFGLQQPLQGAGGGRALVAAPEVVGDASAIRAAMSTANATNAPDYHRLSSCSACG
jgi:hypothetical protein